MREVLETISDYPNETLGLMVFITIIVWMICGMVETIFNERKGGGGDDI